MFRAGGENPPERKERGSREWQQGTGHTITTEGPSAGETDRNNSMYMGIRCARLRLLRQDSRKNVRDR